MKVEVVECKKASRLPEVGEAWTHADSDDVFVRIPDGQGKKACEQESCGWFFSYSFKDGWIRQTQTSINKDSIIILEPIGGVLKLQRKAVTE